MIQSNYVRLMGNLGGDPEMRFMASGTPVASMTIAVNEFWLDKGTGEKKESTTWVKLAAFGPLAEKMVQYLNKGDRVMIEGKLRPPSAWMGKDGQPKATLEVMVNQYLQIPRGEKVEKAKDPWEEDLDEG